MNWSQIAAPQTPPQQQQQSHSSQPSQPSQTSSNRTRNRKNRKRRQKQLQSQQANQSPQSQSQTQAKSTSPKKNNKQWPGLKKTDQNNGKNNVKNNHKHKNGSNKNKDKNDQFNETHLMSFAAMTSSNKQFASTSNPYDTLSISSASSFQTNNTYQSQNGYNNQISQINKQLLKKKEQQRKSALNILRKEFLTDKNDNNSLDLLSKGIIYGVKNRGIKNRNVDCYINAIIQSLLSLPLIVTIFSTIKQSKTAENIGPYTKAVYDTINLFNVRPNNNTTTQKKKNGKNNHNKRKNHYDDINYNHCNYSNINHPRSLIDILDKFRRCQGRNGNGQQDAEEFLGDVISNLQDEMTWSKTNDTPAHSVCSNITDKNSNNKSKSKKGKKKKSNNNINQEEKKENDDNDDNEGWILKSKNIHRKTTIAHKLKMNDSLISMLFGGEFYQIIKPKGNKRSKPSVSYTPFFSISLDINEYKTKTVSSALQNFFSKPEEIDYRKGKANKSYLISESPYYLILHLKRFIYCPQIGSYQKLNKFIGYDTKLTIAPHLLFDKNVMKPSGNLKKLKYELRSVIIHQGDFTTHGHYINYCRREDFYLNKQNKNRSGHWIMFNDGKVKDKIDINTVKSQQGYVLIYQKMLQ